MGQLHAGEAGQLGARQPGAPPEPSEGTRYRLGSDLVVALHAREPMPRPKGRISEKGGPEGQP
jgi:hypothetical protein